MTGLRDLTPDDSDSGGGGKSTHIKFWNARNAADEISDGAQERHKQQYYDAAKDMRNMVGQNINIPVGEFLVALRNAEKNGDYEKGQELANMLFTPDE